MGNRSVAIWLKERRLGRPKRRKKPGLRAFLTQNWRLQQSPECSRSPSGHGGSASRRATKKDGGQWGSAGHPCQKLVFSAQTSTFPKVWAAEYRKASPYASRRIVDNPALLWTFFLFRRILSTPLRVGIFGI